MIVRRPNLALKICLLISLVFMAFAAGAAYAQTVVDQRVVINLPSRTLRWQEQGVTIKEYPVAIGAVTNPTPVGTTAVKNRLTNPVYYPRNWQTLNLKPIPPGPDNPVGTIWIGLEWPAYGIHGTNDPSSIGRSISQGCIRMHNRDVEELFSLVRIGTPVEIRYDVVELVNLQDPWPSLRVHRDIYNRKPDYFNEAAKLLYPLGIWDQIDAAALREFLESGMEGTFTVPRRSETPSE